MAHKRSGSGVLREATDSCFRKEFAGGSKAAQLIASCDNEMTVFINGKRVVRSSDWANAVSMDVQKYLRDDKNTILIEASNSGGPAALAVKLALERKNGSRTYLVTDKTWIATKDRRSSAPEAVVSFGKDGRRPLGQCLRQTKARGGRRCAAQRFQCAARFSSRTAVHRPQERVGILGVYRLR